jgi:hypothetical protein
VKSTRHAIRKEWQKCGTVKSNMAGIKINKINLLFLFDL